MKQSIRLNLFYLLALGASVLASQAQVILNPNYIRGAVRLTNANPGVLNLIHTYQQALSATALPPAVSVVTSGTIDTNAVVIPYQLTVDAGATGIVYQVAPSWWVGPPGSDHYYFRSQISALLTPGGPPATLNFSECGGLLDFHFVTSGGVPVPITGFSCRVYGAGGSPLLADASGLPAGATNRYVLVPSGGPYVIGVDYGFGSDPYTDAVAYSIVLTNTAPCDQIVRVEVVVPSQAQLATIQGNVDLNGEFEMTLPDYQPWAGFTTVYAENGPFGNNRLAAVRGTNFVGPASGPFVLSNLVPSSASTPSLNYQIWAKMVVNSNRDYVVFSTPALGWGRNAGVTLTPGASVNLGDAFVIQPGYLRARFLLQGPPESSGYVSALRNLAFAVDPASSPGIPGDVVIYGNHLTAVTMSGVDTLAAGATYTAARGASTGIGQGAFNPVTSSYEGQVNLPLGGLYSQPSIWRKNGAAVVIYQDATNGQPYINQVSGAIDGMNDNVTISAGQVLSNRLDFGYALSEVRLQVKSSSGVFYHPRVQFSSGTFYGPNFIGELDYYQFSLEVAHGSPTYPTNHGLVVMYLAQGDYVLNPYVTSVNPDNSTTDTALQPVSVHVGRSQRITVDPPLQVQLNTPNCTFMPGAPVPISWQVFGSNELVSVIVSLDGVPQATICNNNCGSNPPSAAVVNLPPSSLPCTMHAITVTVTDALGRTASSTSSVLFSPTLPTILNCPSNIIATCAGTGGTPVSYGTQGVGFCPGPVTVLCAPPSGSFFAAGATPVTCYAVDGCGRQSSNCTFTVTVTDSTPPTIHCPTNVTVSSSSSDRTPVNFLVAATDNCDPTVTVVCTPPSGSLFPIGTTLVSCTATDQSGNSSARSFPVVVQALPCLDNLFPPIASWPGEVTANDLTLTYPGTWMGTAAYATGMVGAAFRFQTANYVRVADSEALSPGAAGLPLTIEAWVNVENWSRTVVAKGSGSSQEYSLSLDPASLAVVFTIALNNSGEPPALPSLYSVAGGLGTSNVWHHLAGVYQPNSSISVYLDGVRVGTTNVIPQVMPNTTAFLTIGRQSGQPSLIGRVDEVGLYATALSAETIQSIYARGSLGKCPPQPCATPPIIQCPTNILAGCAGSNGTPVAYSVLATATCDTNLTLVCTPPSGFLFPLGTNLVFCTASDHFSNTNQCAFSVIVRPSISIQLTVTMDWCGQRLQGADNVGGPWEDIPGAPHPYTVPANSARRFYRSQ